MHLNLRSFCILLLATASATTSASISQNSTLLTTSLVVAEADSNRQIDDSAIGFRLGLGKFISSNVLLELQMGFNDYSGNNSDFQQINAGIDANFLFLPDARVRPYVLLGTGIQRAETNAANSETQNAYADLGVGLMHQVSPNGTQLRADMRIRRDFYDDAGKGTNDMDDFIAHIGFAFPFGKTNSPKQESLNTSPQVTPDTAKASEQAQPTGPVNTPAAPASKSGYANKDSNDSDRDGIKNIADFCPGTTPHAAVDINGCSRKQNGETGYVSKGPTLMSPPRAKSKRAIPAAPQPTPKAAPLAAAKAAPAPVASSPSKPPKAIQPVVKPKAETDAITFIGNSAVLDSQGKTILARLAHQLVQQKDLAAEITGGGDQQRIKTLRAQAVQQYLKRYGVAENRIQINYSNSSTKTVVRLQTQ